MTRKVVTARAIATGSPFLDLEHSPRRKASKFTVSAAAYSGVMESDEEHSSVYRNHPSRQVLKKVVIPVNGRPSTASSLSSIHDHSSEYNTPGTSAVVTPAESLVREERSLKRLSSSHPKRPFMGKRKRLEVDELMEADARLAQELQEVRTSPAQCFFVWAKWEP